MRKFEKPKDRDGFRIAIICALTRERDAVMEMLDETWEPHEYGRAPADPNTYRMGHIGPHNVVVVQLPGMGTQEAASASPSFQSSFRYITLGLVVGICGGVPTKTNSGDILLGDVILSTEIIDYTFGGQYDHQFSVKDTVADRFGRPNKGVRGFLATMEGKQDRARLKTNSATHLTKLLERADFTSSQFPGIDKDIVYPRRYRHKHQQPETCACAGCQVAEDALVEAEAAGKPEDEIQKLEDNVKRAVVCARSGKMSCKELRCDNEKAILRNFRQRPFIKDTEIREPEIHFGVIGSGNSVLKSGYLRDELAAE